MLNVRVTDGTPGVGRTSGALSKSPMTGMRARDSETVPMYTHSGPVSARPSADRDVTVSVTLSDAGGVVGGSVFPPEEPPPPQAAVRQTSAAAMALVRALVSALVIRPEFEGMGDKRLSTHSHGNVDNG
jgi:hypothetical protein